MKGFGITRLAATAALMLYASASGQGIDSLRYKLGQLLIVGMPGAEIDTGAAYDLGAMNVSGVALFAYNVPERGSVDELSRQIYETATATPFVMIDQEGGVVARFDEQNGFSESHSAYDLGYRLGSVDSTRAQAARFCDWFEETGINVNLAPVVDLNLNASGVIGGLERSYSADPSVVEAHAAAFIEEHRKRGVLTSVKHFPGHGSARTDSHDGFTDVTEWWLPSELAPFRRLIDRDLIDMTMIGHLYHEDIDSVYPATLSANFMEGLLRDSLGFEGVAITDEMFMGAILRNYDMEDAFALAVKGGADIVLTARWEMETKAGETRRVSDVFVDYLEEKVNEGFIPAERVEEAYRRVTALKELIGVPRATGVAERVARPETFALSPNYPNPFNGETRVTVSLAEASAIKLVVFDALGRERARLAEGRYPAGERTFRWKPEGAASGAYFIRLTTERGAATRAAIYLK